MFSASENTFTPLDSSKWTILEMLLRPSPQDSRITPDAASGVTERRSGKFALGSFANFDSKYSFKRMPICPAAIAECS